MISKMLEQKSDIGEMVNIQKGTKTKNGKKEKCAAKRTKRT